MDLMLDLVVVMADGNCLLSCGVFTAGCRSTGAVTDHFTEVDFAAFRA